MLARLSKRNGVSTDTTKRIENRITSTSFRNLIRDQLWGDTVPAFLV